MPEKSNTFSKAERLCNNRIIEELFACGGDQVISEFPFLLKFLATEKIKSPFPAQVVIAVGKRNLKKAVTRNRIKRQIRELYRFYKDRLYGILSGKEKKMAILLIFVGKESFEFDFLKLKFDGLIEKFIEKINQSN